MSKKWTITIIVLTALFVLFAAYMEDNPNTSGERISFNVSSGPSKLSDVINNVKTLPTYEGYNTETVKWMESLGDKLVFFGNDSIVIMDNIDAKKIPQDPGITDVYIYNHFTAKVVEKHTLGNKHPPVYYVQNVDFINQEIISNGLA